MGKRPYLTPDKLPAFTLTYSTPPEWGGYYFNFDRQSGYSVTMDDPILIGDEWVVANIIVFWAPTKKEVITWLDEMKVAYTYKIVGENE